jgi:hypothetical protein
MKTVFTNKQKIKAINKIINNNNTKHLEIIYSKYIELNINHDECLFCKESNTNKYFFIINNSKIGYFCSKLCKVIYVSLIKYMLNILENIYIYFPYNLLDSNSKLIYQSIKNIYDTILYYNIRNQYIYIYFKNNLNKYIKIKLKFIKNNTHCLYCNNKISNLNINIYNFKFCSFICKYSFNKEIFPLFSLNNHYNFYLPPYNLIKNNINCKSEIDLLVSQYENINLFGGFKQLNNNKIYIEIFLPK